MTVWHGSKLVSYLQNHATEGKVPPCLKKLEHQFKILKLKYIFNPPILYFNTFNPTSAI